MSNIDLNMILGPEFTLLVVNQSGTPSDETMSLLVESDDLQIGIEDSSSPLTIQMDNDSQILTLGVGIKYSDTINIPSGGLTGQILQKNSDITGDYHWVDADLSGGSNFLPIPDMMDESDPIYFYFGWISIDNSWLVHQQTRSSSLTSAARIDINGSVPDLATAWPLRVTLNYV